MLMKINPIVSSTTTFTIPSSKPETQRAILIASLAHGISYIHADLRCSETLTMKNACRSIGSTIIEHEDYLEIHGTGGKFTRPTEAIDCKGSGLVFRLFAALTSFVTGAVTLTGDKTLCKRIMNPLFEALISLGASIKCTQQLGYAPIINEGSFLAGGKCHLPGNISSQFISAILIAAPFAKNPIEIYISGEVLSKSYIDQTIQAMKHAGITVHMEKNYKYFYICPGNYKPINISIKEDYTAASYLLAYAALFKGKYTFRNIHGDSLQGEKLILDILRALGLSILFDNNSKQLFVENPNSELQGNYEFNVMNSPNIVPTLACIGAYVIGEFRIYGASITRFHKSCRIEAIIAELSKLGVNIVPIYRREGNVSYYDGFKIHGKNHYRGNQVLTSWGDHRIFMSLFVACLKTKLSCFLDGYEDVHCSFPNFFHEFTNAGVKFEIVEKNNFNDLYFGT